MQVQSYLFFNGRCEEALDFYRDVLGAQVDMVMRFKDSPEPPSAERAPDSADKIMHASFRIGETMLMASDGHGAGNPEFKGFALSLNVRDDAEAQRLFAALGEGGQVIMPLAKTFFASIFGMVADRFGVKWMIGVM
ncbi:MAG TPA: VOC family protein [Luteimonas sp.]|nr:VOC family protein [Luteimonas sp.]